MKTKLFALFAIIITTFFIIASTVAEAQRYRHGRHYHDGCYHGRCYHRVYRCTHGRCYHRYRVCRWVHWYRGHYYKHGRRVCYWRRW